MDNKVVMKSKKLKEISGKGGLIKFFWLLLKCPSKYYYFIYEIIWSKRKHYVEAEYNYLTEIMGIDRKEVSIRKEWIWPQKEIYEFCTFSRVCKEKGITTAINCINRINKRYKKY